eukprot:CAMPEP_0183784330 /NCGR_PEP_ID=MMETSP0739-20130205/65648_1 /TAXON_ID=385413 /ORGANISM="Thalassiosira miniscula, Strain CCMP1093" /LENGTH=41 /DNA_ID= /DNA_START= /DNA_END= /DNA_ORIENTATION=
MFRLAEVALFVGVAVAFLYNIDKKQYCDDATTGHTIGITEI